MSNIFPVIQKFAATHIEYVLFLFSHVNIYYQNWSTVSFLISSVEKSILPSIKDYPPVTK